MDQSQKTTESSAAGGPTGNDELAVLRTIAEGTARSTGEEFFRSLVRHMAAALGVRYAFVAEFAGELRARTLAYWFGDRIIDNVEWQVTGTPCADVVRGQMCHYPERVWQTFPDDRPMVELRIESYLGVPLVDEADQHLGHLAVFDTRPMPPEPRQLAIFRIFAARAVAELERLRAERRRKESEDRFRDLFEEAPIAYVHEDLESRFIRANAAATRILGIAPEQAAGTIGMSLVPDTPDAQRRVREAFSSIGKGTDTSGVVLELRRKDNGKPIWIQWWSKPDPGGQFTRTMFVDITDRILAEQEQARLHQQNLYLQEEIKSVHNFDEIVGNNPVLTAVLEKVRRVAATDTTVLITGETGTGKELIARAIHSNSPRKSKPLIKINCAAMPTGLVESELFGHEKGAFTGAIARRVGRFELADGGTIFLDEIGELPPEAQVKLLRVLQEREFERIGGATPIKVDVRVLAATNRDLLKMVGEGRFREDLYYRLNVFPVSLPPLRDRADDVSMLVHFLLNRFSSRIGRRIDGVSPDAMRRLRNYSWPGNVRELENILERAVILNNGPILDIESEVFTGAATAQSSEPRSSVATLEEVERSHIVEVLRQTKWVVEGPRGAGQILGIHPNTLRSRMKKLGIAKPDYE